MNEWLFRPSAHLADLIGMQIKHTVTHIYTFAEAHFLVFLFRYHQWYICCAYLLVFVLWKHYQFLKMVFECQVPFYNLNVSDQQESVWLVMITTTTTTIIILIIMYFIYTSVFKKQGASQSSVKRANEAGACKIYTE